MSGHVFISHSSHDDAVVAELRVALEGLGISTWVDSRQLRGGDDLKPEILRAIEEARFVLAVLGPQTVNSSRVRMEIRHALELVLELEGSGIDTTGGQYRATAGGSWRRAGRSLRPRRSVGAGVHV